MTMDDIGKGLERPEDHRAQCLPQLYYLVSLTVRSTRGVFGQLYLSDGARAKIFGPGADAG